jgi:predicted nucleotidyltransferase component of viral defense system
MHKIARLSDRERSELFRETAIRKRMTSAIAEKDFWVTYVLERIFSDEKLSSMLIFKGGTSLSKVYAIF